MVFAVGYLQSILYLEPCPLCILDRVVVISLGAVFLLCLLQNPGRVGTTFYSGLGAALSLTGIGICLRHIWLQNLPADQAPACGAGFWYMMESMPVMQFMDTLFNGTGDCSDIKWQFLGLSIPELTLILFVAFLALSAGLFLSRDNAPQRV
jgi:disulfide bond formation protein DsbB